MDSVTEFVFAKEMVVLVMVLLGGCVGFTPPGGGEAS